MFTVTIDPKQWVKDLDDLAMRQVPFALSLAINAVAQDVEAEQQEHVARSFTLRRPTFVLNQIMMRRTDFARKDSLIATVRINPDRDLLSKFEDQGERRPQYAGHALAVPIEAKRSKQDIVQNSMRPRALHLTILPNAIGGVGAQVAKGLKRTFLIQKSDGTGGIYQRQGRGKGSSVHLLFSLKTRVPLPRSLKFFETAKRVCAERFPIQWEKALAHALRTAR